VLITRNGKHFSDPKDREHYDYGLVWVTSTGDDRAVAKKIKEVLMRVNFARNPHRVVKV
jgi:Icc-related predicted phosphoesterase